MPYNRRRPARRGAMLVMIAITLPLIVIMAAFAIDTAWMQLVRTELRTATDAASRAGAKTLSLQQNEAAARASARDAASRNLVAGTPLQVVDGEIEIGLARQASRNSRFVFSTGGQLKNAVRVNGNRTQASRGGPVPLFLGRVLGVGSFEPTQVATSTQLDRDICLVVDRSGSMMRDLVSRNVPGGFCNPPHPTLSRWGGLNIAVAGFLAELDNTVQLEQCGLVSYSQQGSGCGITFTTSDIDARLDFNYQRVRDAMARIGSEPVAGFTNIAAGIDNGITVLTDNRARPFALKTMVLMTDGRKNRGIEPVISARRAADEGITIHTVTFSDEADFRRMREVAAAAGGEHFHAPDSAALEQIFRQIASTLPVLLTD
ncbi:MAG: VWA domain-containing protein [Planctomycetota bacterium]